MIRVYFLVLCGIVLLCPAIAGAETGAAASDVFALAGPARFDALVAGVALAGGVGAAIRNPATLTDVQGLRATACYLDWYLDTSLVHVGVASRGPWLGGAFGVDAVYLREGEVTDFDLVTGEYGESFRNGQLGVAVGYGLTVPAMTNLDAGLSVQFSHRRLLGESATSLGLGGGLAMGFWDEAVRAGLSFRNMGTDSEFADGGSVSSPWVIVGGLSFQTPEPVWEHVRLVLCSDFVKENGIDVAVTAGAEVVLYNLFFLRAGYDPTVEDSLARYGVGLRLRGLDLDYAYASHEVLGATSSISITFGFGHR